MAGRPWMPVTSILTHPAYPAPAGESPTSVLRPGPCMMWLTTPTAPGRKLALPLERRIRGADDEYPLDHATASFNTWIRSPP